MFQHLKILDIVRRMAASGLTDEMGGPKIPAIVRCPTSQSVDVADTPSGSIFTNEGATGSITLTLPTATPALRGIFYDVVLVETQDVTLAGVSTGPTALSAGAIRVVCLGDRWWSYGYTYTV